MFKKSLIFISLFLTFFNVSYSYNKTELDLAYSKFYLKIEKNLKDEDKIISSLEKFDLKISNLLTKTKSSFQLQVLNDLLAINKSKLASLRIKKIQKNIEENIVNNTSFVSELVDAWYKSIILNDSLEYKDNWTYRFLFKKYYKLNKDNYNYFIKNKLNNWYVVRYKWSFLVTNDYKIEKKYTYEELYSLFNNKVDYRDPYILIAWDYYTYKYNYYMFFDQPDWLYLSDLERNKISLEKTLLIRNIDWKYFFSNDYKKIRLVSEKIVKDVTNKKEFFYNILDDNRNFENNYDDILLDIKNVTLNLIKDKKSDEEKIQTIYKWVVDNITYYKNYNDWNKQIFSWILTYKNKTWVCYWYAKIFSYMLSFAQIEDVEIKRWFAFDSVYFPNFWHAWVRIWNYYYDPTFDDPVWNTQEEKNEFIYYKLPYDLMYVNRFDWTQIPKEYNWLDLNSRKKIVLKNMYTIYEKYKNYALMSKVKNRIKLWLKYDDDLTINTLKEKLPFYEVNNYIFYDNSGKKYLIAELDNSGKKYLITEVKYYVLNDWNIDDILIDNNIDLNNAKLLKWRTESWSIEYRLAYNLKYY